MTGSGMRTFTDEFKREAVRLVQTSGRTVGQVAADLGVGHSTLGKWLTRHRVAITQPGPHRHWPVYRWLL
ncbi:transposase (fragment) [Magnetospirillum molischianum DSM 120]|uniref:Transposase n=1 Tax=Magnetospirillum molischianum DSM 120 TaxID=1150626 RepID=H8FXT9_MAGML